MNLTPEQLAKTTPDHPIHIVNARIAAIQERMTKNDPEISTHLREVHKMLREYEELAHLLSPEDIGILMRGFQKHTGISLVVDAPKGRAKKEKIGYDDLV